MAKPTLAQLDQWSQREQQIAELRRQANALAKVQTELEGKILPYVEEHGGKARCLTVGAYTLLVEMKKASVQWKPEFVKVAGDGAAQAIIDAQPSKPVLSITKAD